MGSWIVFIGTPTASVGLVALLWHYFGKKYIDTKIDEESQKRLNEHKQQLDALSLSAQYDYQKRLLDIDHYATKKHEIYPKLFHLVLECEGAILSPINNIPKFGKGQISVFRRYVQRNFSKLSESARDDLEAIFWVDRSALKDELTKRWLFKGEPTVNKLRNAWIYDSLYLCDDIRKCGTTIWKTYMDHIDDGSLSREQIDDLVSQRDRLKNLMQQDLGHEADQ